MKKLECIYENGTHCWFVAARDPSRPEFLIDTNEYVVLSEGKSLLLDPGGIEIFPAVFSALSNVVNPAEIEAIFASHQDPDIISSLALWKEANPELKCYISWLWSSFIPHFGGDDSTFIDIPDEGMTIPVGSKKLTAIPAHYLHSSGNFHLYDPEAKILFSGDVGASMIPEDMQESLYVEDFEQHIAYAKGFHQRWMGSAEAKSNWCQRVSKLEIDMICPQHGAIYKGEDVRRFIEWFSGLEVGVAA